MFDMVRFFSVFGLILVVNLILQVRLSLMTSKYLRDGRNYWDIVKAQRLANIALAVGALFFLVWAAVAWFLFCSVGSNLAVGFKAIMAVVAFIMMGVNLLVPIHYEERCEPKYLFSR